MTSEERAARLADMARDAEAHEEARWKRAAAGGARGGGGEGGGGGGGGGSAPASARPAFLDGASKAAFANGSGGLADRVNARKHYTQRGEDGGDAFHR